MVEFTRIQMLFLILVLQFSDITGQYSSFTVRVGDEVTLHCENVTTDQDKCDRTTWIFSRSRNTATVELIKFGQIGEEAKVKSDRLSVTANCSLVIKKVTVEDAGSYFCRQYKSGQKQGLDSQVYLSVVTMTEHKNNNEVTLNCSVLTYDGRCRHRVKWAYQGKDVDKDNNDLKTSQSTCSATVSFLTSHYIYTSNYKLLKCNVTDLYNRKVQLCNISPQLSCEKPGVAETTTEPETTTSTTQEGGGKSRWLYVLLAVVLVALLIIVVVLIRRKRAKVNKTQMDDSTGLSLNPAETQPAPETSQDTDDPEGGVSYASISYTRKTDSKTRVRGKDDADEDDAVTYSTVKASSPSAAASTNPSSLYATVS
ncbi:uncharacterized protein LOC122965556 [Thunnus albacares]|uniref:uncharacterized protein LOC122965556 n=1 Tax=Thunnus albacares TaxID=8236 RepID=UPI001CF69A99|nr:uncharacterized protein LOC122965556 [Thunnus albacares]